MIIDAWMQHPTTRHSAHEMFGVRLLFPLLFSLLFSLLIRIRSAAAPAGRQIERFGEGDSARASVAH